MEVTLSLLPLVTGCTKVINAVHDIRRKFKFAPTTLISIATECSTIHVVLSELQHLRTSSQNGIDPERYERIMASLEMLASCCNLTLEVIEENVGDLLGGEISELLAMNSGEVKDVLGKGGKTKFVFREEEMRELLGQLRGYQSSLMALLATLQSQSTNGLYELLVSHGTVLGTLVQRSRNSWMKRPPSVRSSTRLSTDASSILSADRLSKTVFDFDNTISETSVYQRETGSSKRDTIDTGAHQSLENATPDNDANLFDFGFVGESTLHPTSPREVDDGFLEPSDLLNTKSVFSAMAIQGEDEPPTNEASSHVLIKTESIPSRPSGISPRSTSSHDNSQISTMNERITPDIAITREELSPAPLTAPPMSSTLEFKPQKRFKLGSGWTSSRGSRHTRSISDTLLGKKPRPPASNEELQPSPAPTIPTTPPREYKLVVCGSGMGKTCLIHRLLWNIFVDEFDPTIEDSYLKQAVIDGNPKLLSILDTTGMEEYSAMREQFMRTGEGFLIVYSITSRLSFEDARTFQRQIVWCRQSERVPIILVGTQNDRVTDREVSTQEGMSLAREWGCGFFETSAKNDVNVKETFFALYREIQRYEDAAAVEARVSRPVTLAEVQGEMGETTPGCMMM